MRLFLEVRTIIKRSAFFLFILIYILTWNNIYAADNNFDWHTLQELSQQRLAENPEDILANFQLSISMANLGQIEEAYNHFNKISDQISREEFNKVMKPHLKLLETNQNNLLLLNYAAFSASINKDYLESISYFQQILKLDQQNIWIRNYLAATYIELEDYEQAVKVLQETIKIKDNKYSHLLLGIINYKRGDILKAIVELVRSGDLINKFLIRE
ncbi:MAG: hypothetical protein PWR10_1247 [Halanaerobiales bacterium]|nr:hypothetical protein [Halanaerobiales bacterium]